jgi:hypothetical protein
MNLDGWTEKDLKCLSIGGNKNLFDFLKQYDLTDEDLNTKLNCNAA